MDPPRYRLAPPYGIRPIVLGLAVLTVVGLGAVAWLAFQHAEPSSSPAVVPPVSGSVAAASAVEPAQLSPAPVVTPSGERDPGLVEVCGIGWVEPPAQANSLDPAVLEQVPGIEASAVAVVAGLRGSDDAFERAIGLVLEMRNAGMGIENSALVEELAQQAVTTDDPRAYALAYRICLRTPEQGSCARLSAAQWARLDNGNAAPWLFMLDEAVARNDRALADEALYRIGSAERYDDRMLLAAGPVVARAGSSDSDLVAAQALAERALGSMAALPSPLQRFTRACAGAALADSNRRQSCDAAAATMGERFDSMLIATIGAAVGRRLGWPLDRLVAVRAESIALLDRWSQDQGADPRFDISYSCDRVRRTLEYFRQVAQTGEPQAARAWMAASGKPYEWYASRAREQEEVRRARDAEERSRRSATTATARAASVPE